MTITTPPDAPSRSDAPDVFIAKANAFVAWFSTLVTEMNAALGVVNITKWVSGTTYAVGDVTWSPTDFQAYRRKTAGAGTTDPSADTTNWQRTEVSATSLQAQSATAFTTAGTAPAFTLTPSPAIAAYVANQRFRVKFNAAGTTGSNTLNISGLGNKGLKQYTSAGVKTAAIVAANQLADIEYDGTDLVILNPLTAAFMPPVRQTVLSGPVDSFGAAAFGGSTGSATLTASGTLKVTAAAGGDLDYTGSITNPAWTSPAGSGTGYLMLSVTSAGVVSASVRSLAPAYQWGGTYSTTNGQLTFNIQEMTAKAGNGSTAAQVYEVCVGECAHTSGAWSGSVTWYALMGRYAGTSSSVPSNAVVSKSHNLGVVPQKFSITMRNVTTELGYAAGEEVAAEALKNSVSANTGGAAVSRLAMQYGADTTNLYLPAKSTGANTGITNGNWGMSFYAERGW